MPSDVSLSGAGRRSSSPSCSTGSTPRTRLRSRCSTSAGAGASTTSRRASAARARRLVGVDPDPGVLRRPWLDDGHQSLVEEFAPTTDERFDVALCVYVVEHVEAPGPFLEAIRSLLVPGGSCFGVTPNLWHYFGLASAAAARLGIQDWVLRRLRPPS